MLNCLNYLKIFLILLRIPKLGNLESFYDMVYTMYRHYQYNMDTLPKEIRDYIESLSHILHNVCIKNSKKKLRNRIEDLKLEKEAYPSYDRNSTRCNNEIERIKETIRSLDSLVNTTRGYSELERVLVILYNDIDTSISYSLMKSILSEIPFVEGEVNQLLLRYKRKNIWFTIKNKFKRILGRR